MEVEKDFVAKVDKMPIKYVPEMFCDNSLALNNCCSSFDSFKLPGPGCSKLTTSLVNVALQKLLSFFQQKISVYLVIKSYNT